MITAQMKTIYMCSQWMAGCFEVQYKLCWKDSHILNSFGLTLAMALSIKNESIHVFSFTRILHEAIQTARFADD